MSDTIFALVGKGGLDRTFTKDDPSLGLGVLPFEQDKRGCIKYDGYVIPLHECLFSDKFMSPLQ